MPVPAGTGATYIDLGMTQGPSFLTRSGVFFIYMQVRMDVLY
jgi:hypothetical protein